MPSVCQQGQQSSRLHTKEPPRLHSPSESGYLYSHGMTITGVCINSLGYTERSLSQYSAELPDTYIMTTTAEHQDAPPRWWKISTGNCSQPEERQIGFQCCIEFNMAKSMYQKRIIYTAVTHAHEVNIVSSRRESKMTTTRTRSFPGQLETGTNFQPE